MYIDISSQASLFIAEDVHKEAKGTGQSNVNGAVSGNTIKNFVFIMSGIVKVLYRCRRMSQ